MCVEIRKVPISLRMDRSGFGEERACSVIGVLELVTSKPGEENLKRSKPVLFIVARDLRVHKSEPPSDPVTIPAGETVRLLPEFAAQNAHIRWHDDVYECDRTLFLASSSPIGPAPD